MAEHPGDSLVEHKLKEGCASSLAALPLHTNRVARLRQGFIQILENGTKRVIHNAFADGVIGDGNGTTEFGFSVVGNQRAVGLVGDVDVGGRVHRAAATLALHTQHDQVGVLALHKVHYHSEGTFEAWQRRGDVKLQARGVQDFDRFATRDALLENRRIEDGIENASAICREFVCSVKLHKTLPSTTENMLI